MDSVHDIFLEWFSEERRRLYRKSTNTAAARAAAARPRLRVRALAALQQLGPAHCSFTPLLLRTVSKSLGDVRRSRSPSEASQERSGKGSGGHRGKPPKAPGRLARIYREGPRELQENLKSSELLRETAVGSAITSGRALMVRSSRITANGRVCSPCPILFAQRVCGGLRANRTGQGKEWGRHVRISWAPQMLVRRMRRGPRVISIGCCPRGPVCLARRVCQGPWGNRMAQHIGQRGAVAGLSDPAFVFCPSGAGPTGPRVGVPLGFLLFAHRVGGGLQANRMGQDNECGRLVASSQPPQVCARRVWGRVGSLKGPSWSRLGPS